MSVKRLTPRSLQPGVKSNDQAGGEENGNHGTNPGLEDGPRLLELPAVHQPGGAAANVLDSRVGTGDHFQIGRVYAGKQPSPFH
jgi:hypothetical protein